jgi:hypothetical protein
MQMPDLDAGVPAEVMAEAKAAEEACLARLHKFHGDSYNWHNPNDKLLAQDLARARAAGDAVIASHRRAIEGRALAQQAAAAVEKERQALEYMRAAIELLMMKNDITEVDVYARMARKSSVPEVPP